MTTHLGPCARCFFFALICLVTSEVTATIEVVTSTCETQRTVKGEEATISCHFDKDIGRIHRDFRVNFYPVSGNSDQNPTTVFMCAWDSGLSTIHSMPDYQLVGNISKTIILRIQRVNEAHVGSYACVIEPSNREDAKLCTLFLNDTKTHCEDRTVSEGEETNITCHFADDLNKIHKDLRVDFALNWTQTLYANTVATVQWHDGQPDIHTEPGHEVIKNFTDSLVIIIHNATVANSGGYRCHISPSNEGDAKICNIKVLPTSNGNLTPDISINDDNKWKIIVGAIVGTVGVVGLLVMVVKGIFCLIHKRSVNEATRTTGPTNAPSTEHIPMQHLVNETMSVLNEGDHLLQDETGMGGLRERYSVQETLRSTELQKSSSKLVTSLNRPSPTSNRRTGDMQD